MKKLKIIGIAVLLIIIIAVGIAVYYYVFQESNFISTEDAQVTANIVSITPEIAGKIISWDVKEGDIVKAEQVIGKQEVRSLITNPSVNTQMTNSSGNSTTTKADIKSPIEGKIIRTNVVQGQVVSPGMEIASVADVSNIYIKANIEETRILKVKQGQLVDITVDAHTGKNFKGRVESIGQATQSAFSSMPTLNTSGDFTKVTQLIPIKISIENPDNLMLIPGMNVVVRIHIQG